MQKFAKIATIAAVKTALDELGVTVRFNVITGRIDISGSKSGNPINILPVNIRDQLVKAGYRYTMRDIKDFLSIIADENRYNPVQDMLSKTVWDGQDRIDDLIHNIVRVTSEAEAVYIKRWLHQTIAMAFNSKGEYGADGLLILVGKPYIGKSYLVRKLACSSYRLILSRKNSLENPCAWIAEVIKFEAAVLTSASASGSSSASAASSLAAMKAFITAREDKYRQDYYRAISTKPRMASLCVTTNNQSLLSLLSNQSLLTRQADRRFWVVDANNMDTNRIKALDVTWVRQLWRQVYEELYLPNPQGFRRGSGQEEAKQQKQPK